MHEYGQDEVGRCQAGRRYTHRYLNITEKIRKVKLRQQVQCASRVFTCNGTEVSLFYAGLLFVAVNSVQPTSLYCIRKAHVVLFVCQRYQHTHAKCHTSIHMPSAIPTYTCQVPYQHTCQVPYQHTRAKCHASTHVPSAIPAHACQVPYQHTRAKCHASTHVPSAIPTHSAKCHTNTHMPSAIPTHTCQVPYQHTHAK